MNKHRPILILITAIFILHFFGLKSYARERTGAPVIECKLLNQFPHDDTAFTQGLLYHDGYLYESTGKRGRSSLRKVELESGIVRIMIKNDKEVFSEGICFWNNIIYQLTWHSGKCFIYDAASLAPKGFFKYKGQGWGLTTDGQFLYQSDGSSVITFRDPYDFARIKRQRITDGIANIHRLNELEYINGLIFSNIWKQDRIAAIDPKQGKVKFWLDISSLRPLAGKNAEAANGIAWDTAGKRLFVTGKFWNKVFEIELPALENQPASN
ncbi:glutaminyl-peptide cyclotransferase [Maridesulfovibrio salexigens]|uniref:Glutamine cyclotransferase n=1 Tax=Maridesulfovibrio salexigens (strain ATCC 14822 / DSM 2638 / NCIMB 8403 / VKM B-1763) TaxID=526222 RepID=C6BZ41_MARSD|nr:glutaminyl-peptide cyclotransferase [Maridesulfovibrio salexigens]ACS78865.1 glutamine cyclotransferase [Maridesulfovibrio salexigens DSM 2638]